jgi:nucleoside 2-deoxyribosyltransferase
LINPAKGGHLKVYLAGPDVFFPNALEVGAEKKRICAEYGFEGLFPLDNELQTANLGKSETAEAIFQANCKAMDEADFVIANMMPFRGVSTDAGTAFEIGYVYAQGKPVFGYGSDGLSYLERVLKTDLEAVGDPPQDRLGMHVEDFDLTDNLMLVCAVRRDGVDVINNQGAWNDLSAFTECVRLAAERLPLLRTAHYQQERPITRTLPSSRYPILRRKP